MKKTADKICEALKTGYGVEIKFLKPVKRSGLENAEGGEKLDLYALESGMIVAIDTPTVMLLPSTGCMFALEETTIPIDSSPVIIALRDRYDGGMSRRTTLKEVHKHGYADFPEAGINDSGKLAGKLLGRNIKEIQKEGKFIIK